MTESALSSDPTDTAADRAGILRAPSVDFAHAIRRSHHARSESSCEGEDKLPHLWTALSHLQSAATSLADIHPPVYTEDEAAYTRKWFSNELDQFSSLASGFPELDMGLQGLRQRLESLSQDSSVAERQSSDLTGTGPPEPSEVETTTA
jgi:hypothetical protein